MQFVPFQSPKTEDGKYFAFLDDAGIFKNRREQLGLTQQEVADRANIKLSQYQSFETGGKSIMGASMRIGLSVCAVLLLDPYMFLSPEVTQPDPSKLKPQLSLFDLPELKRVGRKPIIRDIWTVAVNTKDASLLIPYDVLDKLGMPPYINILWNLQKKRILIGAAGENGPDSIDVPQQTFEEEILQLPRLLTDNNPISAMGWADTPHSVESRLVKGPDDRIYLLIDLNTGKEIDRLPFKGAFTVPKCLTRK